MGCAEKSSDADALGPCQGRAFQETGSETFVLILGGVSCPQGEGYQGRKGAKRSAGRPEGTRHRDGRLGPGNRGVGKVIFDTRPVVIPTALIGLNNWKFPSVAAKGAIVFGKPIDFTDLFQQGDSKETHQLIVERVMDGIVGLLEQEGAYVGRAEK
jgi:hypothetical protein